MKTKLNLLFVTALIAIAFPATSQESRNYVLTEEKFKVEFNSAWSIQDLVVVKEELAQNGIKLHYALLEFYTDGSLKKLNASIEYPDGMQASFETRELDKESSPGFRRDFIKHPMNKNK
jgi:hypothetical protein